MPPPFVQSVARKRVGGQVLAGQNGARWRWRRGGSGQGPEHLVAYVFEIGGAGAEIGVVGGLVTDNFRVERFGPGLVGGLSVIDPGERRINQGIVGKKGELKIDQFGGIALKGCMQRGQPVAGLGDCLAQGLLFLREGRFADIRAMGWGKLVKLAFRIAGGGGQTGQFKRCGHCRPPRRNYG